MPSSEYIKVYDFKKDKEYMKDIQDAMLNRPDFGLRIEHGLVGSKEWWNAIEKNIFKKIIVEGIISRVFMSGHNDYPEFEVTTENGKFNWSRLSTIMSGTKYYVVGKKVRITYVIQKFKKAIQGIDLFDKFVLTIEVENKVHK